MAIGDRLGTYHLACHAMWHTVCLDATLMSLEFTFHNNNGDAATIDETRGYFLFALGFALCKAAAQDERRGD
jgi:hypothetical protein